MVTKGCRGECGTTVIPLGTSAEVCGTVTATGNVNVLAKSSENYGSATEDIGIVTGGSECAPNQIQSGLPV